MDFSQAKLPEEAGDQLLSRPIRTLKPFELLSAPAYVHMRLNQKYVMTKRALDFFTEEDLKRLAAFKCVFQPSETEQAMRFRKAALGVKDLLQWSPRDELPPASYEVSDAAIRLLAPLWDGGAIDPFHAALLANDLCYAIPQELLLECRETSVLNYEKALMQSGWAVFLALHLGYLQVSFLSQLRNRILREATGSVFTTAPDIQELLEFVGQSLGEDRLAMPGSPIEAAVLMQRGESRVSLKLNSRFRRVEELAHG